MSLDTISLVVIILLLLMLFSGIKIGITLIIVGMVGVAFSTGFSVSINLLGATAFNAIKNYVFAVIPLFVLMGLFSSMAGIGKELYDASYVLLKNIRGGLAIATIIANAIFAALTGATIASAAVFTKISLPEMIRRGYGKKIAAGAIAGSSVLGMLIPPSNLMIVYGSITGESIGKLFIAGILPGILLSMLYIVAIIIIGYFRPEKMGNYMSNNSFARENNSEFPLKTILKPWPVVLLIILVMGGIWGGFFTATEAGGVGSFGALLLVIFKRKFTFEKLWQALGDAGKTTGSILFLFISAQVFSRMLAMTGIISNITKSIISWEIDPITVIIFFCILQFFMGCILDSTSILLLTIPVMIPVVRELGFDPIWYAIVAIISAEIGLISPPFGISVFTVKSSLTEFNIIPNDLITVNDIFQGSYPYVLMMIVCVIILMIFPKIVTFLPSMML